MVREASKAFYSVSTALSHESTTLYFADDQVVMAEDEDDLNYMVRKLKEYTVNGLRMNIVWNRERDD